MTQDNITKCMRMIKFRSNMWKSLGKELPEDYETVFVGVLTTLPDEVAQIVTDCCMNETYLPDPARIRQKYSAKLGIDQIGMSIEEYLDCKKRLERCGKAVYAEIAEEHRKAFEAHPVHSLGQLVEEMEERRRMRPSYSSAGTGMKSIGEVLMGNAQRLIEDIDSLPAPESEDAG